MATGDRSNLRLSDLKTRTPAGTRMMNVKIPVEVVTAIDQAGQATEGYQDQYGAKNQIRNSVAVPQP